MHLFPQTTYKNHTIWKEIWERCNNQHNKDPNAQAPEQHNQKRQIPDPTNPDKIPRLGKDLPTTQQQETTHTPDTPHINTMEMQETPENPRPHKRSATQPNNTYKKNKLDNETHSTTINQRKITTTKNQSNKNL